VSEQVAKREAARRRVAYAALAVALVGMWTASRNGWFLGPVAVLALTHPWVHPRFQLRGILAGIVPYVALATLAAALYRYHPVTGVAGNRFHYTFYAGLIGLWFSLLKLYGPPSRSTLPRVLLYAGLTLGFVAVGLPPYVGQAPNWTTTSVLGPLTPQPTRFFVGASVVYGAVLLLGLRLQLRVRRADAQGPRAGRRVGVVLAALATGGLGAGLSVAFVESYQDAARLFTEVLQGGDDGGGGGFSDGADLGSVSRHQLEDGDDVALRVFASGPPGYLRGRAFSGYTGRTWTSGDATEHPQPVQGGRFPLPGRPAVLPTQEVDLEVHPTDDATKAFFLPVGAAAVETSSAQVRLEGPGATLRSQLAPTSAGYGVWLSDAPLLEQGDDPIYVAVLGTGPLGERLDAVLAELKLTPESPPGLAVDTIRGHFLMNYAYQVGVKLPKGDVVAWFLDPESPRRGHCELFASAGTLLLRRLGIPARYVTGYVCEEPNPVADGLWVARNRHAHAWVEICPPDGAGWRTVEFTPPGGVPQTQPTSGAAALLEWLGALSERVGAFLNSLPGAVAAAASAVWAWLSAAWWRLLLGAGVLVALGLIVAAWRRRSPAAPAARTRVLPPELAAQRERFVGLEARLRGVGLGRRGDETLLEYAARIEGGTWPEGVDRDEALAFLRAFAVARYGAP
jgi:hypothetical protein